MSSTLEKPRPFESQQETIKTPDQHTPEVPEYDEAGLREMVDQAHRQIDAQQGQVLESADKRMETAPASIALNEAKATPIKQNFIRRIQNIKTKILEIGVAAKHRAQEILTPATENVENKEREKTMERFQGQRGNMLTNILTSEIASNGLDLVPFAGGGKMLAESISGKTLSGQQLRGKDRIVHAAMGAGSLALDFTGIGELAKGGALLGKSVGLIEKLGVRLAEKGVLRSAALFKKTAAFMAKHPEAVAKAEQFAENQIQTTIKEVKSYRKGNRPLEQLFSEDQVPEIVSNTPDQQITEIGPSSAVENVKNPEYLTLQEKEKRLRASREIIDGKLFYAALKGNKEVFSTAHMQQMETDLAMAENKLAEYQLSIQQGEPANLSLEESLKRDVAIKKSIVATGKLNSESYMRETKDGLGRVDGNFVKTEYPIKHIDGGPTRDIKGNMETGLIDQLRNNYLQYRKEFGSDAVADMIYIREAQGVGLGALEAGDLHTARQAFTFTEAQSPMAGEIKRQFEQIIRKMEPETAKQLLGDLGITSVEPSVITQAEQSANKAIAEVAPNNTEALKAGARQSREYVEVRESLKREREISQPMIEEARRRRDSIMEKRGLLQMPKEEFNTYFSSKDFEVISDLKQQNVGDCYLVAAIHSLSRSPNFEMIVRSSMKRLPDGSWQVKVPLLSEEAQLITITPEDLSPQRNEQFLKAKPEGGKIPDLRWKLMPLKGKEGLQVLEAAYMKSSFGKVDRLAAEGGFGSDPLSSFVGENGKKENFIVSNDDMIKAAENDPKLLENPKFVSGYRRSLAKTEHFLENFDPEAYIATANSKPGRDSSSYKVEGTNISLAHGHAYSIVRFDAEKNMIILANPWDTSKPIGLTIQQFEESFDIISAVRIDNAKIVKNMKKIDK